MKSYGRLSTAFYDLDKPVAPPDAIAFYRGHAERSQGAVLEPMCGTGRFLVPLLQAGIPIEGVDASAAMLAACRSSAEGLGLVPKLYEQSFEDLSLPQQYGLAFVPAGSLGLIHQRSALRACLWRLRQHLSQNAILFIELVDVESFEPDCCGSGTRSADGSGGRSISYSWRSAVDQSHRTIHYDSRYQLIESGSVLAEESEELVLKVYTPSEILHELRLAGFSGARIVPTTDEMSWLRESGCSLYECSVPGRGANA